MQIGQFKSTGVGYSGTLETLNLRVELDIAPNRNRSNDKAPHFKVFHGTRDVGYCYKESFESDDGRTVHYLNMKVDDPTFAYPIYGRIYTSNEREDLPLVWSRPKPKKAA